jgi:hypothetical protein
VGCVASLFERVDEVVAPQVAVDEELGWFRQRAGASVPLFTLT